MSELSGQDPAIAQDPLNYAPRWLREKPEQRMPASPEPRVDRDARRPDPSPRTQVRVGNPALDRQLENAVYESLRHSLDPHVMPEPPAFGSGVRRRSMVGYSRLVVAIGVSAVVALLFVIMAPSARQASSGASLATTIEQFSAAVARSGETAESAKPALSEFKGLLAASGDNAQPAASPRSTEPLLQQFLVWRGKAGPSDPPQ